MAAISPTLWPTTVLASRFQDFSNATRPVCSAVRAGCAIAVSFSRLSPAPRASSSKSDQPAYCCISSSHVSRCFAKTGSLVASDKPIPGCCGPWPQKKKQIFGQGASMVPAARSFNFWASALRLCADIARRWAWCDRFSAAVKHKSVREGAEDASTVCQDAALCFNASGVCAESGKVQMSSFCASIVGVLNCGSPSRMMCAFVPPTPKELTPARAAPADLGNG